MSAYLSPIAGAGWQFLSNTGAVLNGGKLYTYVAGSTTAQATWTDSTQSTQNANPIILSTSGRPSSEVWLASGTNNYKFVLTDSAGNTLGTWDNITGISASNAVQSEWVASGLTVTYVSATQFTVSGDQTALFPVNRRVQYVVGAGTFYGYVSVVSYSNPTTTVTIVADSTGLDATLSSVAYGFINSTNTSIPQQYQIAASQAPPSPTSNANKLIHVNAAATGYEIVTSTTPIASTLSFDSTHGVNFSKTTVASATTPDVWTNTGNLIDYTGTATATGFAAAPQAGSSRLLVCASAAVFTAGANVLIDGLSSGSNFTAAAGDKITIVAITTTQFRLMISKYDGTAIVGSTLVRSARTSNTILAAADRNTEIAFTSGTFSQTFTAAATLGSGWWCILTNTGTGVITLDPNGSETIDSLTTYPMYQNESRLVQCDGSGFNTVVLSPYYAKFTTSGTHIAPPGYIQTGVDAVGGGGQGGAGRRGAAGTVRAGGAPGGAPARVVRLFRNIAAGTSTTVTIGAGGSSGGAAQTVDSTNGADGQAGGNTTFGTLVTAYGGAAGKGGAAANVNTSGSGSLGVGLSNAAGSAQVGGAPNIAAFRGGAATNPDNWGEGGGGTNGTGAGGNSEYGGAGSGASDTTATTVSVLSGSALFGVSSASAGGWITAANTLPATAIAAGLNGTYTNGGGATGGTCGAAPTVGGNGAAAATDDVCGNSGAGGGSTITGSTAAKAGGTGGLPGGAGGGGGAVLNGSNSGAGGTGANGQCIVWGVV